MGGNLIVNGNIDGKGVIAIQMATSFVKSLEHNGNATNDVTKDLVGHGQDDIAFWLNNNGVLKLNGVYESDSIDVITFGGAASVNSIKGEVKATSQDAGTTTCIEVDNTAGSTLLEGVKLINTNAVGTPLCIDSGAARTAKVTFPSGSNVAKGANITFSIQPFIVDATYE